METSKVKITSYFLEEFDHYWKEMTKFISIDQSQLMQGNRLRPQICMWGYLAACNSIEECTKGISRAASVSVSIEMIHKASIMLDDWIDGDQERHGMPAYHMEYSPQDTVITALTIIGLALRRLKQTVPSSEINLPHYYFLCLDTLIDTIYAMANGALKELHLSNENIYNPQVIEEIIQLETAEIIGNSMIIGYYSGLSERTADPTIIEKFKKVGDMCGYMFQTMNDLEAFSNPGKLFAHKGNLNSDVIKKRKNIAIATLYNLANKKDKQLLLNNLQDYMHPLITKYHVLKIMSSQLNDLFTQVKNTVVQLEKDGISTEWIKGFASFLDYIKEFGEERLRQ